MDKWGKWLSFDGACWRSDETLFAFDRVRKICRLATAQCKDPRVAKALASASTVAQALVILRTA